MEPQTDSTAPQSLQFAVADMIVPDHTPAVAGLAEEGCTSDSNCMMEIAMAAEDLVRNRVDIVVSCLAVVACMLAALAYNHSPPCLSLALLHLSVERKWAIVTMTFVIVGIDPRHCFPIPVEGFGRILDQANIQTAHIAVFVVGRLLPSHKTESDKARPAAYRMPNLVAPQATQVELRNMPAFRCVRVRSLVGQNKSREVVVNNMDDASSTRCRVSRAQEQGAKRKHGKPARR